jgi:hypothetical protein
MKTVIGHVRANLIAYLALFVALGGTSYAAISIPRNSVGTRQLRNGAVTADKLDGRSIPGHVAFWARVSNTGQVLASSTPARTQGWVGGGGHIIFHGEMARNCFPLANVTQGTLVTGGYVTNVISTSQNGNTDISMIFAEPGAAQPQPIAVDVAEICS